MKIKKLFDDLKQIGTKKYYFKNGEEELYFIANDLVIEIVNCNDKIDIIINCDGIRANFLNTSRLSDCSKKDIQMILNSLYTIDVKCKKISQILIEEIR